MSRTTGYVWHAQYGWHDTGTHAGVVPAGGAVEPYRNFESPESKVRMASLIEVSGLLDRLYRVAPRHATIDDLLRVHTSEHVHRVMEASEAGGGDSGDGFSPFGRGGFDIARLAAGGTMAAVDAVLEGRADNAYALVRPPGHHARPETGMGYCMFHNVAVAIEHARATHGVERIAIVDYDVHHGNGAQAIYDTDPNVLAISLHQDRLFGKQSGLVSEVGHGAGEGTNINVPLPAGSGNGAYLHAIDEVVVPAVEGFRPDLIMVSSGFDASAYDPLGRMCVTADGFRAVTGRLVELAERICDGRLVMSHEGGYSEVYVPFCGLAVLEELCGERTGVEDPYKSMAELPAQELTPVQRDVVAQSADLARALHLTV